MTFDFLYSSNVSTHIVLPHKFYLAGINTSEAPSPPPDSTSALDGPLVAALGAPHTGPSCVVNKARSSCALRPTCVVHAMYHYDISHGARGRDSAMRSHDDTRAASATRIPSMLPRTVSTSRLLFVQP